MYSSYYKKVLEQRSKEKKYEYYSNKLIYDLIDNKSITEINLIDYSTLNKTEFIKLNNALKLNKTVKKLNIVNALYNDLNPIINTFKFNHTITTLKLKIYNISNIDTVINLLKNNTSILYLYLVIDDYNMYNEINNQDSEFYMDEQYFVNTFINKINSLLDTLKTNDRIKVLYFYNLLINNFMNKYDEITSINKRIDLKFL